MELYYEKDFHITAAAADRFDRLKLSQLLGFLQEASGDHCSLLGADRKNLQQRQLFWAVLRHRVQIGRMPQVGETITLQTWPMPTTRTAYPRAAAAYDADGKELFRCISLWVLMDETQRSMVLPGKSGIAVPGTLRGGELAVPGSMALKNYCNRETRQVRFTELDCNGHMNNCRYMDWVADTLPSAFHESRSVKEFSVSYLSEAREGEALRLCWDLEENGMLSVDALRDEGDVSSGHGRVFSARVLF